MNTNYEQTMENFREYLKNSHHNIVAENFDGFSAGGFLCESLTSDKRFILKISINEKLEYVILQMYADITIPKPYRTMAMEYCMKETDLRKLSYIAIDNEQGAVYSHVETSFKDSALSGDTLKDMEKLAFHIILACYDDLQQIARGVLLDNEDKDKSNLNLLSCLYKDMMGDNVDDEDDNDDSTHAPSIDIAEMLRQLEGNGDDSNEEIA